jgi:hypothetical protein
MEFIIFGIRYVDFGVGLVFCKLFFEGNELISFFGIS